MSLNFFYFDILKICGIKFHNAHLEKRKQSTILHLEIKVAREPLGGNPLFPNSQPYYTTFHNLDKLLFSCYIIILPFHSLVLL